MHIKDERLAGRLSQRPSTGPDPGAMRKPRQLILIFLLCLSLPGGVHAQGAPATLNGTVTDENRAVVPNVRITAFSLATALQRTAVTNDDGEFSIPLLPPGPYRITLERDGFATVDVRQVTLEPNQQLLLRVKLKVGQVGEYVTVEAADTSNTSQSISSAVTFSEGLLGALPLNGRSLQSLLDLAPGAVVTRTNFNEQGQLSVDGQRANANYFTIDGVSANFGASAGAAPGQSAAGSLPALASFGGTNNLATADAIAEVRVQNSAYAAEFGRLPGAQIGLLTRAGSNVFHGSVFEYFRNGALDANDWFVNSQGLVKPPLRSSDFGAILSGPIKRNSTSFFFTYEGLRLAQPRVAITAVPSDLARAVAPTHIKPLLGAYPRANGPQLGFGMAQFSASYAEPSRLDAFSLRLDHQLDSRLSLFGRYTIAPSSTIQRGSRNPPASAARATFGVNQVQESLSTVNRTSVETQTLTIGAGYIVSPAIVNEARVNWSSARGSNSYSLDNFGGAKPPSDSFFFPPFSSRDDGLVQILVARFAGSGANLRIGKDAENSQRQINLVDNLTIVKGPHQLKFGVDYRRLAPIYDAPRYTQTAIFEQVGVFIDDPGNIVSGVANGLHVFKEAEPRQPLFSNLSLFAQDSWQASHRLTFNFGVRWEFNPAPSERNGNDPLVLSDVGGFNMRFAPTPIQFAPRGTSLWATTYNNFAPRAGLAYQIFPKLGTTIRAGAGLYYDTGNGQAAQAFGSVFPFTRGTIFGFSQYPLTLNQATPPELSLDPPYGSLFAFDPHLQLPRSWQTSVSVEQPLGARQVVSLAYVGSHGRRLFREEIYQRPDSGSGFTDVVNLTRGDSRSDYHAFQALFQRRLSRGWQAFASYTWSHSIDDVSEDSSLHFHPSLADPGRDRGPSAFDVRHSLNIAVSYDVPPLFSKGPMSAISRNWSFDMIAKARTAVPYNLTDVSEIISGGLVEYGRPNLIPGVPLYLKSPSAAGGRVINPLAFDFSSSVFSGSLGRNALRGFGASQVDAVVRRKFSFSDRFSLQLRAEVYNLFNHPNFAMNSPNLEASQTLGQSLGSGGLFGGLVPMYQMGGPRSIQFCVKVQF
jgi:hypothetical protein